MDKKEGNRIITHMVKLMLEMGDALIVDNNSMVHYRDKPDEPLILQGKLDKIPKKLYIYNTNITDPEAIILNPLSESAVTNKERMVFYSSLSLLTSQWLQRIVSLIVSEANKGKGDDGVTDTRMVSLLAPFVNKVDDTMVSEMESVCKSSAHKDFCNIYYNRTKKTSHLNLGIEDPVENFTKSFGKTVRKKTWKTVYDILKHILKVPGDKTIKEVYTSTTDTVECPNFTTFADVWVRVWECMAPYMEFFEGDHDDYVENVATLKKYIAMAQELRPFTSWLKPAGGSIRPELDVSATESRINVTTTDTNTNTGRISVAGHVQQQEKVPSWMNPMYSGGTVPSWAMPNGVGLTGRRIVVKQTKRPSWML